MLCFAWNDIKHAVLVYLLLFLYTLDVYLDQNLHECYLVNTFSFKQCHFLTGWYAMKKPILIRSLTVTIRFFLSFNNNCSLPRMNKWVFAFAVINHLWKMYFDLYGFFIQHKRTSGMNYCKKGRWQQKQYRSIMPSTIILHETPKDSIMF